MNKRNLGSLMLLAVLMLLALPTAAQVNVTRKPIPIRFPDLTGSMKCPGTAVAGQDLGNSFAVVLENKGLGASGEFSVDLVLSGDADAPMAQAAYSAAYHDNVLLKGGRERVTALAAGALLNLTLNGSNRIPADTPAGDYWLAAVIDSAKAVAESNEGNNVVFCRIRITRPDRPDLRVVGFAFTGSPGGAPPECRLLLTVVNRGPAAIPLGSGAHVDAYVNGVLVESIDLDSAQVEQTAFHDVHFAYDAAHPDRSRSVVGCRYVFPHSRVSLTYRCRGVADPANVIAELDESNNDFSRDETIPAH